MSQQYRDHKMYDYQYYTLAQTQNTLRPCDITIFNGQGPCTCIGQKGPERTEFAYQKNQKFWPIAKGNIGGWKNNKIKS